MNSNNISIKVYLFYFLAALGIVLCTGHEPFFWDTIQLGAMHGDWFYQQNFDSFLLPDHIDSGHIPAFGWYLALSWKIFGQNLWVSHLVMLPWVFLVLMGLHQLLARNKSIANINHHTSLLIYIILGIGLFIVDPVLISQLSLISPDVVLVGAFLVAVNSILDKKKILLAIAVILLGLISLRGVMVASSLFIWQISNHIYRVQNKPWRELSKRLLPYLPGAFLVISYLLYHYCTKGWIIVHSDSPWAESFAGVGLSGLLKQFIVLIWRLLDFGRIFIWLGIIATLWLLFKFKLGKNQILQNQKETKSFIRLGIILFIVLAFPAITSAGLSQHRYFLPFFIILTLVFWQLLCQLQNMKWRYTIWAIAILGLASGNKWIYPVQIAQGWDASLAHKSYFECKKNVEKFISEENILSTDIGSVFPEVGPFHYRYLNNRPEGYQALDMDHQQYVFYSNVMNDFTDEQLDELSTHWEIVSQYEKDGVFVYLYKK